MFPFVRVFLHSFEHTNSCVRRRVIHFVMICYCFVDHFCWLRAA